VIACDPTEIGKILPNVAWGSFRSARIFRLSRTGASFGERPVEYEMLLIFGRNCFSRKDR